MDLFLIPIKTNACNIKSQRIQEHLEASLKIQGEREKQSIIYLQAT